jgi:hypothetical protein
MLGKHKLLPVLVIMAMLLFVPVVSAVECPNLPDGKIGIEITRYQHPEYYVRYQDFSLYYCEYELSGIEDVQSIIQNGKWYGYCVDKEITINANQKYQGYLFSTYCNSTYVPEYDWDLINYIINHKQGKWYDVQDAIWIVTGDIDYNDATSTGKAIYDNAVSNGVGFRPTEGQLIAIYIYISSSVQGALIEAYVPSYFYVPELPFGTITSLIAMMVALVVKRRY